DGSAIYTARGMTSTDASHSEQISRSPMGIAPKLSSCSAMTAPRQRISPRRKRSLPRCRIRLRQVRLGAHAKSKLTMTPARVEQATTRWESRDENQKRDRPFDINLETGKCYW